MFILEPRFMREKRAKQLAAKLKKKAPVNTEPVLTPRQAREEAEARRKREQQLAFLEMQMAKAPAEIPGLERTRKMNVAGDG